MQSKFTFVYPPHPGHCDAHLLARSREYETEQEAYSAAVDYARRYPWAEHNIRIERNGVLCGRV